MSYCALINASVYTRGAQSRSQVDQILSWRELCKIWGGQEAHSILGGQPAVHTSPSTIGTHTHTGPAGAEILKEHVPSLLLQPINTTKSVFFTSGTAASSDQSESHN